MFEKRLREAELRASTPGRGSRHARLEDLYKSDRANGELGFYLAETFFSAGDMERASGYLKKVLAVQPNHFESLVYSGIVSSEAGDATAAEDFHKRALARRADAFLPHFALGALYAHASRWDEAEAELRRAVDVASQPSAHVLLGTVLREKGEVADAIRHLEEALTLQPDSEEAVFQLGLCHLEKNRLKRALECFHEALEKNPRRLEYQEAVRVLERRKLYPLPDVEGPGADAYRRAEEALGRGSLRRAHGLYRQALVAEPQTATNRISFAILSGLARPLEGGDRRLPRSALRRAGGSRGGRGMLHPSEGSARKDGRTRRRRSSASSGRARLVHAREPSDTTSRDELAESGDDLDSALDYAGRALSAAPDELKPYPLAALGWVHYKRQEFDRAIDCLRKASERAPAPTTFQHLGLAYLAAGRPEDAKAAFHKAKTAARGGGKLEDRVMQQVRSNLRLLEKAGPKKKPEPRPKGKAKAQSPSSCQLSAREFARSRRLRADGDS